MLAIGTVLRNRYRILQVLGSGGFGDTYLAEDQDLPGKPHCVVKQLHPKDDNPETFRIAKSLFEREAEYLYRIGNSHPQIPDLYAHFTEGGNFYLVQEFIDGHNLAQELPEGKKLSETETIRLLLDILEVLACVHQHNVIHRDIKLQNLMRRKSDGKIVLIDFGAVKDISVLQTNPQGLTSMTVSIGSPGYMPSEQAQGKPKLSSDVYAVGMIGIQALTGISPVNLPEDVNTGEILWKNLVSVSPAFAAVLDKMTHYHFGQRYRSAVEALEALRAVANQNNAVPTQVMVPPTVVTPEPTPPTPQVLVPPTVVTPALTPPTQQGSVPPTVVTPDPLVPTTVPQPKTPLPVGILATMAIAAVASIGTWLVFRGTPVVTTVTTTPTATPTPTPRETFTPTPTDSPIPSPAIRTFKKVQIKALELYIHPSGIYSMQIPKDWKLTDSSQEGIVNQIWLDSSENALVGVQIFADPGNIPQEILSNFVQGVFGSFPDFSAGTPVNHGDGSTSITWEYTTTSEGITGRVRGDTYITKYPNRIVLRTVGVLADQFDSLEPAFTEILQSFDLNPNLTLP
jgi:serine/threonine protein kinase